MTFLYFAIFLFMEVSAQVQYGLNYNAHKFFLSVDPIFHTTRSSGKVVAKIDRAVSAFDGFLDLLTWEVQYIITSFVTTIVILYSYHSSLGILAIFNFVAIMVVAIALKLFIAQGYEPFRIKDEDAVKAVSLENLQSIQLIRSSFASDNQDERMQLNNKKMMATFGTLWQNHVSADMVIRVVYIISVLLISWKVMALLNEGVIESAIAVGLLLTYLSASRNVIWIGGKASRMMQYVTQIQDLFNFIHNFGKQSYPVIEKTPNSKKIRSQLKRKNNQVISLNLSDLHFDYGQDTKIFDNHSLKMEISRSVTPKLFGIIGPSGTGKTTLLSILGGQLKPSLGDVFVNGIDMYSINDETRKYLVGLQMQTATSLRGTLRYNLQFGLPGNIAPASLRDDDDTKGYSKMLRLISLEEAAKGLKVKSVYSDNELMEVLKKVGLWSLFVDKNGLDTFIGEGGLNLSGGQRQRLNFASLYLRAKYFKPDLIMIDEPTSSLDEISERAITDMILDLSQDALTLVIAHRLKTLTKSQTILDLSMLELDKKLKFMKKEELKKRSKYYNKLISGELDFE
jgi:ABC-type multidrug transport system fused ATPase/permease subunit